MNIKESAEHKYVYVIVRNDLSAAQKAVQAGHAAMESSRTFLNDGDEHPSLIICVVKSENKLKKHFELLSEKLKLISFFEPDRNNEMTAFASEPISGDLRDEFKKFQLLM